jgi:hypothetical protein
MAYGYKRMTIMAIENLPDKEETILEVVKSISDAEETLEEIEPSDEELEVCDDLENTWDKINCRLCDIEFSMVDNSTHDEKFECPICGAING